MNSLSDLQLWLDAVTQAYATGDHDTILPLIFVPLAIETPRGTVVHKDTAGVKRYLDYYLDSGKMHGVTDAIRLAKDIVPLGEGRVLATYESHYLRGATYVTQPYMSSAELQLDEGRWKIAKIKTEVEPVQWRSIETLRPHG